MAKKKVSEGEEISPMEETQPNAEGETTEAPRKRTIRQYWLDVFAEHPKWLNERSNERPYKRYLEDHPEAGEVPSSARQGLSTVKSELRRDRKTRKQVRKERTPETSETTPMVATSAPQSSDRIAALMHLEERIDDVLDLAKSHSSAELLKVVQSLKAARNAVIVLLAPQ